MRASPEREVKLGAAPTFHLPDLAGVADGVAPGEERAARMETTYYDTADLRLARWGLSLRHRSGEGWTLKLPGGSDGALLTRQEVTFDGPARRPPEAAASLVRAYVRGAQLEPVARLSTLRRRVPLVDARGRELVEVVDDEVSILQGRRVAARFREVEVELRHGGEGLLDAVVARLRQAGAGESDATPKHVRALGPAAQAPPDVAVRRLPADAAVVDVVRNALAAGVDLVLRHDAAVRLGGDAEAVHQARVGTRRLRSHLRTFAPLLDRSWSEPLRDELGWLAGELGAVRDAEVLRDRLEALARELPEADGRAAAALTGQLRAEVASARKRLDEAMAGQRYLDLLDRLVEAANAPVLDEAAGSRDAPPAEQLAELVLRPWRKLRRAVEELPDDPADEQLHDIRIQAKRVRYAAEAVTPAIGRKAARFGKLAADLQTELGEHQDSVTAQAWLRGAASGSRKAFVAGELCALEAVRAERSRGRWQGRWRKLSRRSARAWIAASA